MSGRLFFEEAENRFVRLGYIPNTKENVLDRTTNRGLRLIEGVCHHKYVLKEGTLRLDLCFGHGPSEDEDYNGRHFEILFQGRSIVESIFDEEFDWPTGRSGLLFLKNGELKIDLLSSSSRKEAIDWMMGRVHQMHVAVNQVFDAQ